MTKIMTNKIHESIEALISAYDSMSVKSQSSTGKLGDAIESLKAAFATRPGRPRVVTMEDIQHCIKNGVTSGAKIAEALNCSQPTISRMMRSKKLIDK